MAPVPPGSSCEDCVQKSKPVAVVLPIEQCLSSVLDIVKFQARVELTLLSAFLLLRLFLPAVGSACRHSVSLEKTFLS